jgi:hypothetical protein
VATVNGLRSNAVQIGVTQPAPQILSVANQGGFTELCEQPGEGGFRDNLLRLGGSGRPIQRAWMA